MMDSLPKIIVELKDDVDVEAIVGSNPTSSPRVRGLEAKAGDIQERASYRAFIVCTQLASPPEPRVPVQRPRIAVRCYGRTKEEASALYVAASNCLHRRTPRLHSGGLGIYASFDDTGGTEEKDPDTGQPVYSFIVSALATTQAVAV